MKKLLDGITKKQLFFLGLGIILLAQIPMLFLGTDSIVAYHDQLDGEIISYIYQAKYLFSGNQNIPEFLNDASKTALTPPAPLAVLLFRFLPPFAAYMVMYILGQTVAFSGMFLLVDLLTGQKYIALIAGGIYAFLPFLPLYGLSQYGVPMLLFSFICLWQKRYRWQSMLYVAFYAGMSSLVLCGFTWIMLLGMAAVVILIRKKIREHLEIIIAWMVMTGIYILTNLSLVFQILGLGSQAVSHKSEYVLEGSSFWMLLKEYFMVGGDHSMDYHKWIILLAGIVLVVMFVERSMIVLKTKKGDEQAADRRRKWCIWLLCDLVIIFVLCVFAAFWNCTGAITFRSSLGAAGAFQFGRILWIAPAMWYLALSFSLAILWTYKSKLKVVGYGISAVILGILGLYTVKGSSVLDCVQEIVVPEYETISWSDYLALGVMDQVEALILEDQGLDKSQYKVASLGIDPAAALYHGFYCVDGYSNNYDVEYKHAFRKVIAPELERNEWLKKYFDEWGNRCYLFSNEIPGYYNIEKGSFWYSDLQIDTAALKGLGCDYILSAAYVVNAEDIGLELLQEEAVGTPESYYQIYIYKIR